MAFKYSFSKRYNRTRLFDIDTKGLQYHELQDIFGNEDIVYTVEGIYINDKSQFEPRPCVVASVNDWRGYVNLPAHLTSLCEEILQDPKAIEAINSGKVGFSIYTYWAYDKQCYSIRWIDL